jgi:hypothetical protein
LCASAFILARRGRQLNARRKNHRKAAESRDLPGNAVPLPGRE